MQPPRCLVEVAAGFDVGEGDLLEAVAGLVAGAERLEHLGGERQRLPARGQFREGGVDTQFGVAAGSAQAEPGGHAQRDPRLAVAGRDAGGADAGTSECRQRGAPDPLADLLVDVMRERRERVGLGAGVPPCAARPERRDDDEQVAHRRGQRGHPRPRLHPAQAAYQSRLAFEPGRCAGVDAAADDDDTVGRVDVEAVVAGARDHLVHGAKPSV